VTVALPESRPEDDEDVVWGLSTASALWARGERRDAIVWLRRAADAAVAAGQEFRGSELGMYASELEDGLGPAGAEPESAAIEGAAAAIHATEAPAQEPIELLDIEADRPSQISIDLEDDRPTTPATPPPPPPGRIALTPGPVPPPRSAFPPPAPLPPLAASPPPTAPASSAPRPITAAPPAAPAAFAVVIPPPAPLGIAAPTPAAPPPAMQMPHSFEQTPMPAMPMVRAAPTSSRRMTPTPPRKSQPRGPILDPWADEPTDPGIFVARPTVSFRQSDGGDELVLPRRSQSPRSNDGDDEVVTSAAPLDASLSKKVEPRAPRKVVRTQPSVAAPGQLAQAAAVVPSKALSVPPAPAPPSAPAPKPPAPPPSKVAPPVAAEAPHAAAPVTLAPAEASPPVAIKPPAPASTAKPSVPPPAMPWPAPAAVKPSAPPAPAPTIPKPSTPPAPVVAAPTVAAPTVAAPTVAAQTIAPAATVPAPSAAPAPRFSVPPPPAVAGAARVSVPPPPAVPSALKGVVPAPSAPTAGVTPPVKSVAPPAPVLLDGLPLDEVDAFVDLPPEMQQRLVALARIEALAADEEVSSFGAALLLKGEASVCATIVDTPACRAVMGTLVPSRGSLAEPVGVRVVAGSQGARVAIWDQAAIEEALASCPWVLDELVSRADRIQALAGATMGPLGDLDEASRGELLDRLTVHFAQPFECLVDAGGETLGVAVVGGGVVELGPNGDTPTKALHPGEMLFARAVIEGLAAPRSAHAGASGALVLIGEAKLAKELMVSSPPFASLFSDASE
jgi:hypothetical protein